jgi:hypothetical protein
MSAIEFCNSDPFSRLSSKPFDVGQRCCQELALKPCAGHPLAILLVATGQFEMDYVCVRIVSREESRLKTKNEMERQIV